jgi:hypothetical protein
MIDNRIEMDNDEINLLIANRLDVQNNIKQNDIVMRDNDDNNDNNSTTIAK